MITLLENEKPVEIKTWKFPGGEVGVQLKQIVNSKSMFVVRMDYETSDDIMYFLNVCDALEKQGIPKLNIVAKIPYLPYARQDRVCNAGESFALEVFVKLLSTAYFEILIVWDLHSEVATNLFDEFGINHYYNKPQWICAKALPKFDYLVAPDEGAKNKAGLHTNFLNGSSKLVTLSKVRKDGKVIYEDYAYDTIQGSVCVVDDLCDFGGTFLSLGEMLKRTQPKITSLNLYVTHGLFGKGVEELNKFYDTIYVHNLMNKSLTNSVKIIK